MFIIFKRLYLKTITNTFGLHFWLRFIYNTNYGIFNYMAIDDMAIDDNNLIWIDLEMTGLNPEFDRILEVATLITDSNLNILAEGPGLAIHQSEKQLSLMNNWNVHTHQNSGLIDKVRNSFFNEDDVATLTIDFLKKWVSPGKSPICGNCIGQDRRFLFRYMPKLESYFHYRYLDVSTIKELVRRWKPDILLEFKKSNSHNAITDIRESVEELIFYRKKLFNI